jgi:glutamine---fructose-6-phosphate transaminase (isomerizing)
MKEKEPLDASRERHPYHMHDAILAQPGAVAEVAGRVEGAVVRFAERASACRRVYLVGIGTSQHAARVGEHLFRYYGGAESPEVRAVNSFDFVLYGPELVPEDCVVVLSHRGTKRFSAEALRRAEDAGCFTALVTGKGAKPEVTANVTFETVEQENSSAFTVSYAGTIATLASFARHLVGKGGASVPSDNLLREELPTSMREALGTEEEAAALAHEHAGRRRIFVSGGGPSAVTAEEVALKIRETSYLQAEGMQAETMLHGHFQSAEADDLFVLIAPAGAAQERTLELAGAAREIGAPVVLVDDGTAEPAGLTRAARRLTVPPVPEPFTALTCLVPLQLFAYHLALARGTNPDIFRTDDARFARVRSSVQL